MKNGCPASSSARGAPSLSQALIRRAPWLAEPMKSAVSPYSQWKTSSTSVVP